jgi:hypothetical protein
MARWERQGDRRQCTLKLKPHAIVLGKSCAHVMMLRSRNIHSLKMVPREFNLQGARLAELTQAIAYRGHRSAKHHTCRVEYSNLPLSNLLNSC